MTSALTAAARHLRIVDESAPRVPGRPAREGGAAGDGDLTHSGEQAPVVGYVVLVPEGTELTELFTADGKKARLRPLLPAEHPPAPPAQHPPVRQEEFTQAASVPSGDAGAPSAPPSPEETSAEGVHVDPERHTARVDGRRLDLTYLEFELLAHFVANPYRVHTRAHLVGALWGYSHVGDGRTVDVHIARLRRKLGRYRETIVTVRRVGYKYEPGRAD